MRDDESSHGDGKANARLALFISATLIVIAVYAAFLLLDH